MRQTIIEVLTKTLNTAQVEPWAHWTAQAPTSMQRGVHQAIATQPSPPTAVVYPQSDADLSAMMTCAHQHQWRVLPMGQGSKLGWGSLGHPIDVVISMARLNRIVHHAVGDLTVTVEAGVKLADLQTTLAQQGQFLALDPAYGEQATLGGIVATADAGPWRHRYGGVRDMLIGLTLVRADGQVAKAGGQVVKNVAGYDLMKLMTGAYGTLGLLCQLTFRTYPLPEASHTVVMIGSPEAVAAALTRLKQSVLTPVAFDVLSPTLVHRVGLPAQLGLALKFQGIPAGVKAQVARSRQLAPDLAVHDFSDAAEATFWQTMGMQCFPASPQPDPNMALKNMALKNMALKNVVLKLGVQPSAAVATLTELSHCLAGMTWVGRIHGGSGLGQVAIAGEMPPPAKLQEPLLKLRAYCEQEQGFLTLLQAPTTLKQMMDVWGYTGSALPLMQRIKQQFDPLHLINPGRFLGDI